MPATSIACCPACGGERLTLVPRGYAGKTDAADQYAVCQACGQIIYEIMAVTQRDIRLHRYEVNGIVSREGFTYRIRRLLKVGFDEYLLYLRLELDEEPATDAGSAEREPAEDIRE